MPYDLLVYSKINWKLQGSARQSEIDRLTSRYSGARLAKALSLWYDKCRDAHNYGDIIAVYPGGTCVEQPSTNSRFWIIKISDGNYEVAKNRAEAVYRSIQYERTLNNTSEHIYEYRIWVDVPIDNFHASEYFSLPIDASIISRNSTEINVRLLPLTHPSVIRGDLTAIERRNNFQAAAKDEIQELQKILLRHRYRVMLETLPGPVLSQLNTSRWVTVTQAQLLMYIEDKLNG